MEFRNLQVGTVLPTLRLTVSPAANERYWASAGVEHRLLRGGALYPPIAANLTVLLVQQVSPGALLHTEEALASVAGSAAGGELAVTGTVADAFEKRARDYLVVDAEVAAGPTTLWRSRATFTPTGARPRPTTDGGRAARPRPEHAPFPDDAPRRSLALTADALRAYSRSGNFHSDPDEARRLGMPGLVAQGMQVCGPAYGVLLDAWGDDFLERGGLTARFVGMVVDGQTIEAAVINDETRARFEVRDEEDRVVAFGTARRRCDA
jgi:acyl dehydratase